MSEEVEPQPAGPIDGRVVGTIHTYGDLVEVLRARAQERKIALSNPLVSQMAGLPEFYILKLLSVHPVRRVGMISLEPLLSVLGIRLLAVEDKELTERYTEKLSERNASCAHDAAPIRFSFTRRYMKKIGANGAKVRWERARRRSAQASRAARARWKKATAKGEGAA